ncbi:hypothetical protein MLD38_036455 [Melastoma candidum]|uniref:Uncharacterized protein n=1 Tax=Melastoma candidum TaxID=119954 RepID=A0ACB9LLM0_9MYRT|nr:hypothetical protein MLD38_036455 [Melastoma candidum]
MWDFESLETWGWRKQMGRCWKCCKQKRRTFVGVLIIDPRITDLLRGSDSLCASALADLDRLSSSIQDLQRKIESCKEKTEVARAEVVADSAIDMLPKELDEQRASIEDRERVLKRLEKQELREQMMLSMYASVTTVIPNLTDDSNVSGYIVDRKKNVVERFQFDSASPDACESIWSLPCNLQLLKSQLQLTNVPCLNYSKHKSK